MERDWYLYILQCKDGSLYTGVTNDVQKRLEAHREGRGAKYTRGRSPLTLVYQEKCGDKSAALRREAQVKKLRKSDKLQLIHKAKLAENAIDVNISKEMLDKSVKTD